MLEVCFENHNKFLVEKGRISERWPGPCRVKEAVAKQRQEALERKKIHKRGRLVRSEMSYSILPGLYLLFQHMALLRVVGTFEYPRWHWTPQFSQPN